MALPSLAPKPFLDAEWRYLAMLNFAVAPDLLALLVPEGSVSQFIVEGSQVRVFRRIDDPVLMEAVLAQRK